MSPLRRRLAHDERGVYTVELLGLFPYVAMVVLLAFQLAAVGGAMNMAENAARNGSRMAGVGGDARAAALAAVDPDMRGRTTVSRSGQTVTVRIDVPIVIPFIDLDVTTIERAATLPSTSFGSP